MKQTTYLKIKVTPQASKESLVDMGDGRFVVSVREKAQDNKATARSLTMVALHVGVPVSKLRVLRGHHTRNKVVEVLE
ncbi:DUF167 domain-containing protein [Candidatus Campbellbacteria bacterium]|nr:MAG: DUF167 domain-containing protein [Candidatus Campbellbacteria bacterium]